MLTKRGLTLIELMVALVILALMLSAIFAVYIQNLTIYKSEVKTAETQVEKILSLELLRRDIVHAGLGLPWGNITNYSEASTAGYNDAPSDVPRAFVLGNDTIHGADCLVIKSAIATDTGTTRKWGILSSDVSGWPTVPDAKGEGGSFDSNDRVVIVDVDERNLYRDGSTWHFQGTNVTGAPDSDRVYVVYGIANATPRMPFNRADYYLSSTGLPARCNPNTYVLYRATINHSDGARNAEQFLTGVRDFQVAFGLDTDSDENGTIDAWSNTPPGTDADIREQVKEVRVFMLYHEGQRSDSTVTDDDSISLGDADTGTLSTVNLTAEDKRYRWKTLKVAARPLNLGG